jgi:hypothetical protein
MMGTYSAKLIYVNEQRAHYNRRQQGEKCCTLGPYLQLFLRKAKRRTEGERPRETIKALMTLMPRGPLAGYE